MRSSFFLFLSFRRISLQTMNSRHKPWFSFLSTATNLIELTVILVLLPASLGLQKLSAQEDDWKIHLQMTVNLGYPENNIGARIVTEYLGYKEIELALAYSLTYHFDNFGPRENHLEQALSGSFHYIWGNEINVEDNDLAYIKYLDSRRRKNSVGYSWQRFFNRIGTSQNVGTIHMRFNKTVTQFSNDVFANTNGKDRYRTGAFAFGFYAHFFGRDARFVNPSATMATTRRVETSASWGIFRFRCTPKCL